MRVHPTGTVTVFTGSHSHGQGHETTFAQVVAARLGIPVEQRRDRARRHRPRAVRHGHLRHALARGRRHGDRQGGRQDRSPRARRSPRTCSRRPTPTSSSRTASSRSPAPTRRCPSAQVALTAYVPHNYPARQARAGPERERVLRPDQLHLSRPAATSARSRSIRDTGKVQIEPFTAVDDFGNIVNPMIVEGQVHGGLAQGIGQALMESCAYDTEVGPAAHRLATWTTPCRAPTTSRASRSTRRTRRARHNPLGVKGCGEAGAIGSPPAVINALDRRARRQVDLAMPATPERVWRAAKRPAPH